MSYFHKKLLNFTLNANCIILKQNLTAHIPLQKVVIRKK